MTHLLHANIYVTNIMLRECGHRIFFASMENFKIFRLKNNCSYSLYFRRALIKSQIFYPSDAPCKKYLLHIRNAIRVLRENHYLPHNQKYVLKPVNDSRQKAFSHKTLTSSLRECKSVEEQVGVFHSTVKLTDEDISSRISISQELVKVLKPYYSSCSVHLFGSSVNKLGLRGCDVDLSLQYAETNINKCTSDEDKKLREDIADGKVISNKLYNFPQKTQLLSIRKILQDLKYEEPITVIPGRCPILSFYIQNLSCDLSINNSSAFLGTNLMLLCGKLDERVVKLMQIIKYWAKHNKLIGGPVKFKSYALFLMVIYFLQSRNPPVLPTVEVMFENTDFLKNLQNWSDDVNKYIHKFQRSSNTQTVEELLREFFFFYGNFDFSYIICPISGTLMDQKMFASTVDCQNSFELNTICIQDPLNFTYNVTTGVNWKTCKHFLKSLVSVCDNYQHQNCHVLETCNWGLASLIDNKYSHSDLKNIKEVSINIPLMLRSFNISIENNNKKPLEKAAYWIQEILNYCLLFQCHLVDFNANFNSIELPQNVKMAIESEFLDNCSSKDAYMDFKICYVCGTRNTWLGRNTFNSASYNTENMLEKEHLISKKMCNERGSNDKEIFYFSCECFCKVEDSVSLHIKLKPLNSNNFIPKLAIFLKEYIPKFLNNLLLDSQIKKNNLI